jgi:Na+/melibiose symporter-like transporter
MPANDETSTAEQSSSVNRRSSFAPVLRNRSFRYLVGASTVTALGDRLTHMLLITLIAVSQPGKILAYSEGALVFSLPAILFSPVVGVLIDRWDKRKVLAASHFVQGALLLLAPLLIFVTGSLNPVWIVLLLFFTVDIFDNSTSPAMLPAIVEPERIVTANSTWSVFARFAAIIGMVGGGFLVKSVGWKLGFTIDASTHLISAFLVLGILPSLAFRPNSAAAQTRLHVAVRRSWGSFFQQLGEVIRLLRTNRYVEFVVFSLVVSQAISGIAYSVLLFLVQQKLKLGTAGVGIYTGILAAGMILGAVSLGIVGDRISKTRVIVFGIALIGGLFVAGTWLINIWFLGVVALLAGVTFSGIGIAQTSLLQTKVALDAQGRIFATREFFSNLTFILVTFAIGLLSLMTVLRSLLLIVGAALLLTAAFGFRLARALDRQESAARPS